MCARFLSNLSFLCIGRVHGAISGCTVLGEVHPVSAQNKSLISDTVNVTVTSLFYSSGMHEATPRDQATVFFPKHHRLREYS